MVVLGHLPYREFQEEQMFINSNFLFYFLNWTYFQFTQFFFLLFMKLGTGMSIMISKRNPSLVTTFSLLSFGYLFSSYQEVGVDIFEFQ